MHQNFGAWLTLWSAMLCGTAQGKQHCVGMAVPVPEMHMQQQGRPRIRMQADHKASGMT